MFVDRKFAATNLEQLKKRATDIGLSRRGSLERKSNSDKRSSWASDDLSSNFDTFRPVTLTISNFFKQVNIQIVERSRLLNSSKWVFICSFCELKERLAILQLSKNLDEFVLLKNIEKTFVVEEILINVNVIILKQIFFNIYSSILRRNRNV